ncbi:MAG: AAA family ATPase [Actinomycetota bacterium]|nr:AAA family ATPase [Actinomycetota bacterium]
MAGELKGREHETRSIDEFLERAALSSEVLVLVGEPGIGKTALWQAGVERARAAGNRVLAHRAVEAEATLAFVGVSDLFTGVVEEVLPSLGELRRRALEAALLLDGADTSTAAEPRAVGLAVLDSLKVLSAEAPLLLAVDDFQWLDTASARTLLFAIRRLSDETIGTLITARPGARELERGLASGAAGQLCVGPLDTTALFAVLRDQLGLELSRPQLTQLREVTGGNPFYALQIARELALWPPAPGQPLRIPGDLREVVGARLAKLPSASRETLLLAAAAARPTVATLTAARGDSAAVREGLEQAARAGVVELDGQRVRFSHPLLASICYDEAPPWRRREVHAGLATAVSDREERARHLALAAEGPDPSVAAALDEAAPHALARGAPAAAAELYEIAALLTPSANPAARRQRRLAAAEAHRLAGDRDRAAAILDELLVETPPGAQRGDVLFALAQTRQADLPTIVRWCESALEEVRDDHRRAAEILAFMSWMRLLEGRVRDALAHARAALDRAKVTGDDELLARAIARVAMAETWTLQVTPGLLEHGLRIEQRLPRPLEFHESPRVTLARRLMCLADFDGARPLLAEADDRAKATGDEGTHAHVLFHRFQVEWFSGHWDQADRLAGAALELAEQLRDEQYRGIALYARALLDAHLGRVEAARSAATESLEIAESLSDSLFALQSRTVLGFLALSAGDPETADQQLRKLPAWLESHGWAEPTDFAWINAIEAMIAIGELGEARACLERYEQLARRSDSPWALATAARSRGLLAAAEGEIDTARAALDRALAEHDRMHCPFERGRTLLAAGHVRRRAREKRSAREALEQALQAFDQLGARLWADQAREQLARISGRRPATGELTAAETELAALTAEGLSNKEIAAALHMSVHTVEGHLTRIYRKLGIRSRAALASRLASTQRPESTSEHREVSERT